jgi:predicted NUDIX family NTP pyrophosphohydrolase
MPDAEVLLVHPGGPLWSRRDDGWWSVPKGEVAPGEDPRAAAEREFEEELGLAPPPGPRIPLGEVVQAGGKHVVAFAVEGDVDLAAMVPGTTEIQWPPRSGRMLSIPEVDRAVWFRPDQARIKLLRGQLPFLDRLEDLLGRGAGRLDRVPDNPSETEG